MAALGAAGAVPQEARAAGGEGHEELRVEAQDQRLKALLLACSALDARKPAWQWTRLYLNMQLVRKVGKSSNDVGYITTYKHLIVPLSDLTRLVNINGQCGAELA